MDSKKIILASAAILAMTVAYSQNLNWAGLKQNQRHVVNINGGMDYSVNLGVGYGYRLIEKWPAFLFAEYSQPVGNKLIDDFKTKLGAQVNVYHLGPLHFVVKAYGIFRRYENDYVSMLNFGSDLSGTIGYYKPRWFAATEVGFDKAIVTHFKHSETYREHFPEVKNGWYEPATGGNFYYGLQGGYSFARLDVYLKAGKVISQDFKTEPTLPFYAQLGLNLKFTNRPKS